MADTVSVVPEPDDTITVGVPGPAPAGVAFVPLTGVTLLVDPTDPDGVPAATVYEPDQAGEIVAALYGDDAAEALDRNDSATVPLADSAARETACRLGVLRWLLDNRPLPLDNALLDLEAAVTAAELPGAGGEQVDTDERVATFAEMARRIRNDPGLPLADELLDLFERASIHVPRSEADAVLAAFAHERALLKARQRFGSATLTAADLAWLAAQLRPATASHLGEQDDPRAASLDWVRVPSGLLPAAEGTVTFRLPGATGSPVEVDVAPPPRVRPHPAIPRLDSPQVPIVASLRSFAWPLPLASGSLQRRADGGWSGQLPITPDALELALSAPLLDVDVRAAQVPWSSPNRRRHRESAARRWAGRGFALRRLAAFGGSPTVEESAVAALGFAARLWASSDAEAAARCRSMASAPVLGEATLAERWLLAGDLDPT